MIRVLSTGGGGGGVGEGSTPNSTSSPPKIKKKLLKVHKGVNYACTHNFKYTCSISIYC